MIEGQEGVSWQQWCDLADACEQHGVETLFRSDHYISQANETGNVAHDAWTTLAGLAARTTTLRLGTLVSPATFRLPGLLANTAATVDHIWTEERVDFHGTHYTLENAPAQPKPAQKPRPPILVGGSGTRGTAEPAARFADEYNTPFVSPDDFARIRAKVQAACETTGRSLRYSTMTGCLIGETRADAIERARMLYERVSREPTFNDWLAGFAQRAVVGSVEEVAARLREYERAG